MTDQTLQKSTTKRKKKTARPRYVLLWENIQSLQIKLVNQEATNQSILRQFSKKIRPLEESITHELSALTNNLIKSFHSEKSTANRSLIGFWIIENFTVLASHPFANTTDVETLYDEWRLPIQGTDDMVEAQLSLLMAGRNDLPGQSTLRSNYPDADMFAAKDPTSITPDNILSENDGSAINENPNVFESDQQSKNNVKHTSSKHANKRNNKLRLKETVVVNDLTESGSNSFEELFNIDKLFRRIARAVHPDREQNEKKKAQKHAIMSECLQARENDDIATLLTLYAEHVGNLPDSWSNESTGALVSALEEQLRELEIRSAALSRQDPVLQMILDRYLGYDTNDVDRRIQTHQDKLTIELDRLKLQRSSLKTEKGWADALNERRDIELDKLVVAELTQ